MKPSIKQFLGLDLLKQNWGETVGSRIGAFLIDWAIVCLVLALIFFLSSDKVFYRIKVSPTVTRIESHFPGELIFSFLPIIYHIFFLSIYSSTPGKMLYGLEVTDEKTGERIHFGKALIRSLSYIVSSVALGFGYLRILTDAEKHQGYHDLLARTLVVRTKKKPLTLPIILSIISWVVICLVYYYFTVFPSRFF